MAGRIEHWFNRRYGVNRRDVYLLRTETGWQVLGRHGGADGQTVTHYFAVHASPPALRARIASNVPGNTAGSATGLILRIAMESSGGGSGPAWWLSHDVLARHDGAHRRHRREFDRRGLPASLVAPGARSRSLPAAPVAEMICCPQPCPAEGDGLLTSAPNSLDVHRGAPGN
jgi:hypothetical protein